jgi:hypothetical protein
LKVNFSNTARDISAERSEQCTSLPNFRFLFPIGVYNEQQLMNRREKKGDSAAEPETTSKP